MTGVPEALAGLFPSFVRVAAAPCDDDHPVEWPEEAALVTKAVPRRRREFAAGRLCAHQALRALGVGGGPVLAGARREPIWPLGTVGSIAHAGAWSVAAVARAADTPGLGIDVEVLEPPLDDDVDRLVRTSAERDGAVLAGHPLAPHTGKLVFSVKEAVYKAVFSYAHLPLEFPDVTTSLQFESGTYEARLDPRFGLDAVRLAQPIRGRFRVVEGYVLSGCCLPAVDRSGR